MKKKIKLPILLLAVVIMLSIFYVKEANKETNTTPTNGTEYEETSLNPEFTEARILNIQETNAEIQKLEDQIACGNLSALKVSELTTQIEALKEINHKEVSLEEAIIDSKKYADVLVLYEEDGVVIGVYTAETVSTSDFIDIVKLARNGFGRSCKVTLNTVDDKD